VCHDWLIASNSTSHTKSGAVSAIESQLNFTSSSSQTRNQKKCKKLHDEVKVEKFREFRDFNFKIFVDLFAI
jgi:hypothetical protein